MIARKNMFTLTVLLALKALIISSCTYTTPATQNEVPGLEKADSLCVMRNGQLSCRKSFFGIAIDHEKNKVTNLRKKWMCGWAPSAMGGKVKGGYTAAPYRSGHCNMEFKITQNGRFLEGREINVDYLNDWNKWQKLLLIPITSHFFYEKEVDNRGRELNRYRKVTDRENWKVSPFIDLDLGNAIFTNREKRPFGFWGAALTDIYDIEATIEKEGRHFFGFTGSAIQNLIGSTVQHELRFNFYEIKDNPKFVATDYHTRNSQYMNILHIMGNNPSGMAQIKKAAHWDTSKPIEFCLNGFPDDYRNYKAIGSQVLEEMNKAFRKIGVINEGQKLFVESKKQLKYHYDLRCPSITWVDDPLLSFRAPLGIGLVNTNIKTGEILWGNAIVWGGLIDYIVNRDVVSVSDELARGLNESVNERQYAKHNPYFEDLNSYLSLEAIKNDPQFVTKNLGPLLDKYKDKTIRGVLQDIHEDKTRKLNILPTQSKEQRQARQNVSNYISSVSSYVRTEEFKNLKSTDLLKPDNLSDALEEYGLSFNEYVDKNDYVDRIQKETSLSHSAHFDDLELEFKSRLNSGDIDPDNLDNLAFDHFDGNVLALDGDNLIENHYEYWTMATHGLDGTKKLDMAKSVIKNVMLHELGHVVGMGHQFEGNRLPEKGSVPDKYYNFLAEEAKTHENYTSIMDYMSGLTEVNMDMDKVKLQGQDELVLRYLYKQEYATYRPGDQDFTFFKVPSNGVIPPTGSKDSKVYQTQYFPQCSDVDAWKAVSPYCRRWDRGFDAASIVTENFAAYSSNFLGKMNNFTEATGDNPWMSEYRLWRDTYSLMNNNRTFYDHLRYTLEENKTYNRVFKAFKSDEKGLIEFSKACIDPSLASDKFALDFARLALKPSLTKSKDLRLSKQQSKAQYGDLLASYKKVAKSFKASRGIEELIELSPEASLSFEEELNRNGVALTEMNKLCRATKLSLNYTKILLSLAGPDHSERDYSASIVPTGLHAGNSTPDYSRLFGINKKIGYLPLKIAALDVLTALSSTMRWGWWRVGKPRFVDKNDGKYGYFPFYPEEFTDIIGTAVKNNMNFGGDGITESATLSYSNLYLPFFLHRTFSMSGDKQTRKFHRSYLNKLKEQTSFSVDISVILLQPIKHDDEDEDQRFGFNPKLYVFGSRDLFDLPEAFLLEDSEVIVRPNKNQIIMPISKMRFINADNGYVWAIEVSYSKADIDDEFQGFSVKNAMTELTDKELNKCLSHEIHGLDKYFKHGGEFNGFTIPSNIALDNGAQTEFQESIKTEFSNYKLKYGLEGKACSEQVRGVGLITSTALSLDGFFIREIFDYIQ